ncbi:MAG: hypothetical protein OXP09_21295 [Gammaproteobacteria bacterium]|nr:hypothetical protein [Gammaproteobacteria bacterium]
MDPNFLRKLRRRFSDKPNAIQTRDGVSRLDAKSLHRHWIVGRGLCMYRCEDFTNVPKGRRPSALALQVPVWSPFENTGFHAVWAGATAMVWFWDSDVVRVQPEALFENPRPQSAARVRVRPESVFLPRKDDGVHLQTCREGFELQHWQGEVLQDAFWFQDRPDEARIDWFCRRQGVTQGLQAEAEAEAISPEPWRAAVPLREWMLANERPLAAAVLTVLVLVLVWQEVRIGKMDYLGESAAAELAQIEEQLGPALDARNELLRLRGRNEALGRLLALPSQARIIGLADRAVPGDSARFYQWRYQQGELRLTVEDPNLDPIAYVRALEAVPLFDQVQVGQSRRNDRVEITLRVRL